MGVLGYLNVSLHFNTPSFGSRGSEVRILSPRPTKKGLNGFPLGPFFVWVTGWVTNEGVFRQVRMGYSSQSKGQVVPKTLANFLERKTQLYEQGATVRRIGQYVKNWWQWV